MKKLLIRRACGWRLGTINQTATVNQEGLNSTTRHWNLHFWRFCARGRRQLHRPNLAHHPHPYNIENYLQFLLIFNIVIRRTGKTNAKLFFEFYVMHENANYIYAWNCFRKRLLVFTLRAFSHYTLAWRPTVLNRTNGISGPPLPSFQWRLLKERVFAFSRLHHFFGGNGG